MILAAGYGKRMENLTDSKPKPLLEINNKELLRHNIDFFMDLGCKDIVINTHYLHKQIKHFVEKYYSNSNIQLIHESTLLNTGGGIKNALSLLGDKNFLVTNADILWKRENKKDVLNFINKYQDIHLEIAADYLVMAAWLTYLKSRLLLPKDERIEDFREAEFLM